MGGGISRSITTDGDHNNGNTTPATNAPTTTATNALQEPLLSTPERFDDERNGDHDHATDISPPPPPLVVDGLPWNISLLIKALFFLDALGASTWGRFSAIYYNLHGLNARHIGLIEGARSIIPTVAMVAWGIVADQCHSQKKVWLVTKGVSTAVLLTLALPWIYSSFARILAVSVLSQLFVSSGILDAYTLELLGTENKIYYGRYRLFASLSWGIGSIIMGWVTDHYGFEPNFIMFGLLGFLMIVLVATKIPETSPPPPPPQTAPLTSPLESLVPIVAGGNIMELVCLALQPRVFIFLIEVIVMGAGMATVERLLFLYMVNDLEASTLLCGLSVGVNVLFELPLFWYAKKIMKIFGHDGLFMVAMTCFIVRLYGYTLLTPATKWWILVLEIMHGITFACFWIVSTDISKILVHYTEGAFWKTAIPSAVQMLYTALGVSLGSIVGGWAMNRYGSRIMYIYTALMVAVTLCLHIIGSIVSRVFCHGLGLLPDQKQQQQQPAHFSPTTAADAVDEEARSGQDDEEGEVEAEETVEEEISSAE